MSVSSYDDPRKLRVLIERAADHARAHEVSSVLVGLAAPEGDLGFPGFVEFLRSALRVEDSIFHMTRERVVVHLADVDARGAREVLTRILADYSDEFPSSERPEFEIRVYDVSPTQADDLTVKSVLKVVFGQGPDPAFH